MTVYVLTFLLFLVGLYGVLVSRNLVKIVISLTIMEFSIFLLLALIGYIQGGDAPILVMPEVPGWKPVFPLPQAMVLTAIVIGLATNAMILTNAIRLYKKYGTFDIREIRDLKG
ncbi:MAG TPA: sodium:proton antiporter [Bacteroidales bacterium]|nr:sodium:proton antiporter [Bacteroidales bacterium]